MHTHGRWLKELPFLRDSLVNGNEKDEHFLASLTSRMHVTGFVQGERFPVSRLYVVRRGLAVRRWRIYSCGKVRGAELLLSDQPPFIPPPFTPPPFTFTDVGRGLAAR